MAFSLNAKAPTEVVERRWIVPVDSDDSPASVVLSASGVTVDANSFEGNELVLTLSAGAAAVTGTITATVTTAQSRVLVETLVIPITVSTARERTVQQWIEFALRKVFGAGRTPNANATTDALERLEDMLATWKMQGAAIGMHFPITLTDSLALPDWQDSAVKNNLALQIADLYGLEVGQVTAMNALRGLQQIKQFNMPDVRDGVSYL